MVLLKRETKEELSVDLDIENAIKINHYKTNNVWLDVYLVKQDIDLNKVIMQKEEVSEVKFASFEEIERLYEEKCKEAIYSLFFVPKITM